MVLMEKLMRSKYFYMSRSYGNRALSLPSDSTTKKAIKNRGEILCDEYN